MMAAPPLTVLQAPADWRVIDFVSDLHLKPEEPATFEAFALYLQATRADAVLILGDLFEAWIGDDGATPDSFEARCGQALAGCGATLAFMRGNRDFLVGPGFLGHHGLRNLADPTVLVFGGQRWLLSHGDLLCTDDVPYQQFRAQVRAPEWQRAFLARPLAERHAIARQMRAQSQAHHADDPAHATIDETLARHWLQAAGATTLIHGHTHQPADHALGTSPEGRPLQRIVLSDWHIQGHQRRAQVLRLTTDGLARIDPLAADR